MSIADILSKVCSRMVQGMMVHEQLMNCYLFLGLPGYSACHEYHYTSETRNYIELCKYAVDHFGIIARAGEVKNPDIIPETWFNSNRESVKMQTRIEALKSAYDEWIDWEEETKKLYQNVYTELVRDKEIPFSEFIKALIIDVEEELTYIKNERLHKEAMDYDMASIMEEQDKCCKVFRKLIASTLEGK